MAKTDIDKGLVQSYRWQLNIGALMIRRKQNYAAYHFYWRKHWRFSIGSCWLIRYRWNHHVYGLIHYIVGWRFVECSKGVGGQRNG